VDALRFRIRRALSRRDEQLARAQATARVDRSGWARKAGFWWWRWKAHGARSSRVPGAHVQREGCSQWRRGAGPAAEGTLRCGAGRSQPAWHVGLRVIEQAQRLLPHCASVLYTAYPSYETIKEAFELGVDGYLARPSEDLKALAEKVAGALRSREGFAGVVTVAVTVA